MLPLRTPSSGRTQVFGVMLAATTVDGAQGGDGPSEPCCDGDGQPDREGAGLGDGHRGVRIDAGDRVLGRVAWLPR
eukprot:907007-Pyramimonas_sp.AAC.1